VTLGGRGFMSVGAAVACCALAAACTEPAPTSTPSATSAVTTPSESQIERQMRLDYEAAQVAYKAAIAEQHRQAELGIAELTPALKTNATDAYLDLVLTALRYAHDRQWRSTGSTRIVGIVPNGWQKGTVRLISCEDSSGVRLIDKKGNDVTRQKTRTYVQDLTVKISAGRWKVADASTTVVKSFESQPCAT
jgi:hypothetical protein